MPDDLPSASPGKNEAVGDEAIWASVLETLETHIGRPQGEIDPGDHVLFDLGMDSQEFRWAFVPQVEDRIGLRPLATEWEKVETVQDVFDLFARVRDDPGLQAPWEPARSPSALGCAVSIGFITLLAVIIWLFFAVLPSLGAYVLIAVYAVFAVIVVRVLWVRIRDGRRQAEAARAWRARRQAPPVDPRP
jgi:acyl carrier protein